MKLNLSGVRDSVREHEPFSYTLDLTALEYCGMFPVTQPVQVSGQVSNNAELLTLTGTMSATLNLVCDRCASGFTRDKTLEVSCMLAQSLERDDSDNVFVYTGDFVELDDIFIPEFILDLDMKVLCKPDCKGLCARCGKNLNSGDCECAPETDSRWDVLKELL